MNKPSKRNVMTIGGRAGRRPSLGRTLAISLIISSALVSPLGLATAAHAQDYTNVTASGRIVDGAGRPVAGARVTMTSQAQGFSREAVTDESGGFRVPQLPAGRYRIVINADGFRPYAEDDVAITIDNAASVFTLASLSNAATGEGDIIVTGSRRAVADFERTTTGAVLDVADLAGRVPVSRDLPSVIRLAPGTDIGISAFGGAPSISGASVSENVFYVNGLNITDFRRGFASVEVPFEFYETVEVKTGGFQAEFGRATGGVVNAITRSGSNEFHAGMIVSYEPDRFRSTSPNTAAEDNDSDYRELSDASIYASGPIIRDRLFFYGLFNPRSERIGDGRAANRRYDRVISDDPFYGAKIDGILADGHRLEFTFFSAKGETTTESFNFDPDTNRRGDRFSTSIEQFGGDNYVGRYTGVMADWLTVSAAYGVNRNREITESKIESGVPAFSIFDNRNPSGDPDFSPLSLGNPITDLFASQDTRRFYRADVDVTFEALGSHHIRFGYDREDLKQVASQSYTGGVYYEYFNSGSAGSSFQPDPFQDYVAARSKTVEGTFESRNQAFYIQDNWTLLQDRLNLQIGVRNDRFTNYNSLGEAYFDAKNLWSPRIGFSADVFGDRRTKVFGSFARYFLPLAGENSLLQTGGVLDYTEYFELLGTNGDGSPILGAPLLFEGAIACPLSGVANCTQFGDGTARDLATTVASNVDAQYVNEFILGFEQRLTERWRVGLTFTHRQLKRVVEDFAIDQGVRAYCARMGLDCGDAYQSGFDQFILGNPGGDVVIALNQPINGESSNRVITLTQADLALPQPRRNYTAITFTFDRSYDSIWSLSGSYTWAKSRGNTEGGVSSDYGQDVAGYTSAFDQPGLTDGTFGYLPGDRRHTFKLYGSYEASKWLTVGGNILVQSPRRYGCLGLHPTDTGAQGYGPLSFYCRVASDGSIVTDPTDTTTPLTLTPRGSRLTGDWVKQFDVSLNARLPIKAVDAQIRLDVFNVLNNKARTELNEYGTDGGGSPRADYGAAVDFQSPRSVRLQLSIRY